jgi:hypothetical protein
MRNTLSRTKLQKEYPKCFKEYLRIHGDEYLDFMYSVDVLLFNFGIKIIVNRIDSMKKKTLGYTSIIEFTENNKLNRLSEAIVEIEDYRKYKSYDKARTATFISALNMLEEMLDLMYAPWH